MLASNGNQISSFPFMNQSTSTSSLEKSIQIHDENENPISRFEQNHPPSLQLTDCYNYNPFLDEEFILSHILYSQKQQLLGTNNFGPEIGVEISANNTNEETTQKASSQRKAKNDRTASTKKPIISRKRSSNKDRHSKICTSKGPRDRRMRLSLEIARSFFDLQDMLGFDKASKTVEWLFAKSTSAIKELKEKYLREANCNNIQISNNNDKKSCDFAPLLRDFSVFEEVPRQKKRRKLRIVDKESRYKARARARERTRAKLIRRLEISKSDFEGNPDGICKMGDVIEESGDKSKILEYQQTLVSQSENEEILGSKEKNSASLIRNQCEDKLVSKETCSDQVHLPSSSFDNMKASPPGLKLLELDEIDRVLIFYGEYEARI